MSRLAVCDRCFLYRDVDDWEDLELCEECMGELGFIIESVDRPTPIVDDDE